MLYYDLVKNVSTEQYMCTSCNNNDGVACVTDFIPFLLTVLDFLDYKYID